MSNDLIIRSNKLKQIILKYLKGEDVLVVKANLIALQVDKHTFKETVVSDSCKYVDAILLSLNVNLDSKPELRTRLFKKDRNLYDFLVLLYQGGYEHLRQLIDTIDKTNKKKISWAPYFILASIIAALMSILHHFKSEYFDDLFSWFYKQTPKLYKWIVDTFSVLRNVAILGLVINSIFLFKNIHHVLVEKHNNSSRKISESIFDISASGLNIVAYSLSIAASGIISPIAVGLFIGAAVVDVFKSIYSLAINYFSYKKLQLPSEAEPWQVHAEYHRKKSNFLFRKKALRIEIASAVLITVAIVIWYLMPLSLPVMIGCLAFMILTSFSKKSLINKHSQEFTNELQETLSKVPGAEAPGLNPHISACNREHELGTENDTKPESSVYKEVKELKESVKLLQHIVERQAELLERNGIFANKTKQEEDKNISSPTAINRQRYNTL